MLTELHIENFAIIDQLDVTFQPGLVAFTGETGAGKSIIIDAVETLMGGRADANLVRVGAERATVEAVFHLTQPVQTQVQAILEREELLDEPGYVTLGREIRSNGRSVARLNGRSVTASLLREVGEYLIDVHGQSEHLSLLRVNQHLGLLDRYASASQQSELDELLQAYQETYQRLAENKRQVEEIRQAERDAARRSQMLSFQIQEIEGAHLKPGEDAELRDERNRLANAESLTKLAQEALLALDEGTPEAPAATDLLGRVVHALNGLARFDPRQASQHEQAQAAAEGLAELAHNLRAYLEEIEFNPRRLDQVEERLDLINNLKRKYGESIPEILQAGLEAQEELLTITHAAERLQELEAEQAALLEKLAQHGLALSATRRAAAEQLSFAIEHELSDLHMSGARFQVDFQQAADSHGVTLPDGRRVAYHSHGLERVEFLIAPNPGEGFKPLVKIASGGETSRLMLALKNVLAQADHVPTLIFDEIDQGIGGRVGAVIGEKLQRLGQTHQVLCITHLPQLAVFGAQHLHVEKRLEHGRTTTQVRQLEGEARILELAQMLGSITQGSLQSARELVAMAQKS
jgi:DNA repair protein RecN (Recombination protein N)